MDRVAIGGAAPFRRRPELLDVDGSYNRQLTFGNHVLLRCFGELVVGSHATWLLESLTRSNAQLSQRTAQRLRRRQEYVRFRRSAANCVTAPDSHRAVRGCMTRPIDCWNEASYPPKYPLRALTMVEGRLTLMSSRRHSRSEAASIARTYCWRRLSIRLDAVTVVSTSVLAKTNAPPVHSARSRRSALSDCVERSIFSSIDRSSIEGTVATINTGTSMELARPDASDAVMPLLVSMPSVSTTTALCVPARVARRRALS